MTVPSHRLVQALGLGFSLLAVIAVFAFFWAPSPTIPAEPATLPTRETQPERVDPLLSMRDEPAQELAPVTVESVPAEPETTILSAANRQLAAAEERYGQLSFEELKRTAQRVRFELNTCRRSLVDERLETGEYEIEVRRSHPGQTVELGQSSDPFGVQFGGRLQPLDNGSVELHKVTLSPGEDPTFDRLNAEYYWLNARIRELEKSAKRD